MGKHLPFKNVVSRDENCYWVAEKGAGLWGVGKKHEGCEIGVDEKLGGEKKG